LLFELDFSPFFNLYTNIKKKTESYYAVTLTTQIKARSLHTFSGPLVTPSYIIHLRYNRKTNFLTDGVLYNVLGFSHHSTGQTNHIIKQNARIDTLHGNFSTHFFTGYLFWTKELNPSISQVIGLGFVEHFPDSIGGTEIPGAISTFLGENYGRHRIQFEYRLNMILAATGKKDPPAIQLKVHLDYNLIKPPGNKLHIELVTPEILPRNIFVAEMVFKPGWHSELAFFMRYRNGQDHYNLFFFNRLQQIEVGIVLFKDSIVNTPG
ncbi:MAG: hypothetical protein IH946_11240, partial [Bacteroidetes bacterium]|nr:hypothetical protein [Bacteroidota bacterium]